jgi:geranylgeranyl diphosphate synthase type II
MTTTSRSSAIEATFSRHRAQVDVGLQRFLGSAQGTPVLHEAMGWMLFGGGKRIRPVICLAAFDAVGGDVHDRALPAACAVEMVHTYSLVHDDLPSMDDDRQRRGRPTVHVKWDEATAVLAGDALLTEAFRLAADVHAYPPDTEPRAILRVVEALGRAAGRHGMVGGQALDMGIETQVRTEAELIQLHGRKTGELFRFAAFAGAVLGGAADADCEALADYGSLLGLAFQVADDVLDLQEDREPGGRDQAETPSFPALIGEQASRSKAFDVADQAIASLAHLGDAAAPLRALARYAVERDH